MLFASTFSSSSSSLSVFAISGHISYEPQRMDPPQAQGGSSAVGLRLADVVAGRGGSSSSFALTATPSLSSVASSSDLDSESSLSFLPDNSSTLGSLIGIVRASDLLSSGRISVHELSQQLVQGNGSNECGLAKLWSLIRCGGTFDGSSACGDAASCLKKDDDEDGRPRLSLGYFLEIEREAADNCGNDAKVYINVMYEESGSSEPQATNPLFDAVSSSTCHASYDLHTIAEEAAPSVSPTSEIQIEEEAEAHPSTPPCQQATHTQAIHASDDGARALNMDAKGKSKLQVRSQCDTVCIVNCISFSLWPGIPKMTSCKTVGIRKVSSRKISASEPDTASHASALNVKLGAGKCSGKQRSSTRSGCATERRDGAQIKAKIRTSNYDGLETSNKDSNLSILSGDCGTFKGVEREAIQTKEDDILNGLETSNKDNDLSSRNGDCGTIEGVEREGIQTREDDIFGHSKPSNRISLGTGFGEFGQREICPFGHSELSCTLSVLRAEILSNKKKRRHAQTTRKLVGSNSL